VSVLFKYLLTNFSLSRDEQSRDIPAVKQYLVSTEGNTLTSSYVKLAGRIASLATFLAMPFFMHKAGTKGTTTSSIYCKSHDSACSSQSERIPPLLDYR
jgi:hypothetical protein